MGGWINRETKALIHHLKGNGRKLYQAIRCMACGYKFRTPLYKVGNYSDGYSGEFRKESDPCPKCKTRTIMEEA